MNNETETSKPADLLTRRVQQEDTNGCVVATLAMLTGDTYDEVKSAFSAHDFSKTGCCSEFEGCNYLRDRGFAYQKMYKHNGLTKTDRDEWPLLWSKSPLLVGYMAQVILGNNAHAVAVRPNGSVLDPWREGEYRLTDYTKCNHLIAVFDIRKADHVAEVERLTKEIESLLWNLGSCDTIASGWSKPFEYNKEMARPALDSVSRLAAKLELAESKLSQLQLSNEEKARKIAWAVTSCAIRQPHLCTMTQPCGSCTREMETNFAIILAILNGGQQ